MQQPVNEKEQLVYEAVFRLIDQGRDLNTLKASDIAAEAGIAKGSLYNYFTSKEEILRRSVRYVVSKTVEQFLEIIRGGHTFLETCGLVFDIISTRLESRHMAIRLLANSGRNETDEFPRKLCLHELPDFREQVEDELYRILQMGVQEGILKPCCRDTGIFVFLSALAGYFYSTHTKPEQKARAMAYDLLKRSLG